MNNLEKIKKLEEEIKILQEELDQEKTMVLEHFRNMSEEDMALCDNVLKEEGISITYYPPSVIKTVDTAKLKQDGLYEQYSKESKKSDYIRVRTW